MLYGQKAEESASDCCPLIQKGEQIRQCRGKKQRLRRVVKAVKQWRADQSQKREQRWLATRGA